MVIFNKLSGIFHKYSPSL